MDAPYGCPLWVIPGYDGQKELYHVTNNQPISSSLDSSVGKASDFLSEGREFDPHLGRNYLKKMNQSF